MSTIMRVVPSAESKQASTQDGEGEKEKEKERERGRERERGGSCTASELIDSRGGVESTNRYEGRGDASISTSARRVRNREEEDGSAQ